MMRIKSLKWCISIILLLIANEIWAQVTVYCIPQQYTGVEQRDANLSVKLEKKPADYVNRDILSILHRQVKGKDLDPSQIFVTKDEPYPNGKEIKLSDITKDKLLIRLDSVEFDESSTLQTASIFIKYLEAGQYTLVGPIKIFKLKYTPMPMYDSNGNQTINVYDPCYVIDSLIRKRDKILKDLIPSLNHPIEYDTVRLITKFDYTKYDSVIREKLLLNYIVPNNDAVRIFKIQNDTILTMRQFQDAVSLKYPDLVKIEDSQQNEFKKQTQKALSPNRKQSRQFKRITRYFGKTLSRKFSDSTHNTNALRYLLLSLQQNLKKILENKKQYSKISLVYANTQLRHLIRLLKKDTTFKSNDVIDAYVIALIFLSDSTKINTYSNSTNTLNKPNSFMGISANNTETENVSSDANIDDLENQDNNLRNFNFYISKIVSYDTIINHKKISKEKVVWDTEDIMWHYKVYCVPKGDFLAFMNKDLTLEQLSNYACSDLASVSNKDLALLDYYFFAVNAFGEKQICSQIEGPYNTINIKKVSSNPKMTLPYAYQIIVNK